MLTRAGFKDLFRAATGGEPYLIPAVAKPGELGAMTQPDSYDGYHALFEPGVEFATSSSAAPHSTSGPTGRARRPVRCSARCS